MTDVLVQEKEILKYRNMALILGGFAIALAAYAIFWSDLIQIDGYHITTILLAASILLYVKNKTTAASQLPPLKELIMLISDKFYGAGQGYLDPRGAEAVKISDTEIDINFPNTGVAITYDSRLDLITPRWKELDEDIDYKEKQTLTRALILGDQKSSELKKNLEKAGFETR